MCCILPARGRSRTQREVAQRAYALCNRTPKLTLAGKPMLRALGLFNPMLRELAEKHYQLTDPVVLDDTALQSLIGPTQKTSYEEGIAQSLAAARRRQAGRVSAPPIRRRTRCREESDRSSAEPVCRC